MDPDVRVSGTYREYFLQLRKRLDYLHKAFARLLDEKISPN